MEIEDKMVVAGTVKDAILERLIAYTPVKNHHQVLVLVYTMRQLRALSAFVAENELDFDLTTVRAQVETAISHAKTQADDTGYFVPEL